MSSECCAALSLLEEPREGKGFSRETQGISEILTSKFSFFPHTALPCADFFAGNGPERSSIPQTKPVEQYFRVQPLQYKTSKKSYGVCASNLGKQPSSPHRENVFSRVAHLDSTLNHNVFPGYQTSAPAQGKAAQGSPWQASNLS